MVMATTTAIALALAAAAAGASYYNTRQTQKKADAVSLQGLQQQKRNAAESSKRTKALLDDESASTLAGAQSATQANYQKQVAAQAAQANAGLAQKGLNADFDERAGGAAQQNVDWSKMAANLLGTIDGAQVQRDNEAKMAGNASMDYSVLGDKARGDQWVTDMRMKAVRRNPYIDLAAGLMNGAAGAVGSYAGGSNTGTTYNASSGMSYPITTAAAGTGSY